MNPDAVRTALDELAGYAPTAARVLDRHFQGRGGTTAAECATMLDTPAARHISPQAMATLRAALAGSTR
ncbi:MAG TPA: hypothetical protein VFX70_14890 [Mycobacteriales bacterium]|nr:hypothetical protein [Mycobacteriales bacterium]